LIERVRAGEGGCAAAVLEVDVLRLDGNSKHYIVCWACLGGDLERDLSIRLTKKVMVRADPAKASE